MFIINKLSQIRVLSSSYSYHTRKSSTLAHCSGSSSVQVNLLISFAKATFISSLCN